MQTKSKTTTSIPVLNNNAAGIDLGARHHHVAVPEDKATPCVRMFDVFTEDLVAIAEWLHSCEIETVAMESTGVYWIPLFQILEERGFKVCLVNSRDWRNTPGRKTDVDDSQWLQYLHACGLLKASFRPDQQVCAVRSLLRHREGLITSAASATHLMQKSLNQMNLVLHNVISDITGKTGLAIIDAILGGERDPAVLSELRDPRIKCSKEIVAKSLVGDYRPEHLFTLKQTLDSYRHFQKLIDECDTQIELLVGEFDSHSNTGAPPSIPGAPKRDRGNVLRFKHTNLHNELIRLIGIDLTLTPGFGALTVFNLIGELGCDLSAFRNYKCFCSWLGVCPGNHKTGGKAVSTKTRDVPSRAAHIFRVAAQSLWHSQSELGDFYRRICARLGRQAGNTATAHKLARIYYHLITTRTQYDEAAFEKERERLAVRRKNRLEKEAARMGFQLVPAGVQA
jgi:transposase